MDEDTALTICRFLGYGNLAARIWFVGHEEGLGSQSEYDTRCNLAARGAWRPVMGLQEAHLCLTEDGLPIDLRDLRYRTHVWDYQAKFLRCFTGEPDWQSLELARQLIAVQLGSIEGSTFLTEVMPFPARNRNDAAPSREMFSRILGEEQVQDLIMTRWDTLRRAFVNDEIPRILVRYGKPRNATFPQFEQNLHWQGCLDGRVKIARGGNSRLYVQMPFFGSGQISHILLDETVSLIRGQWSR